MPDKKIHEVMSLLNENRSGSEGLLNWMYKKLEEKGYSELRPSIYIKEYKNISKAWVGVKVNGEPLGTTSPTNPSPSPITRIKVTHIVDQQILDTIRFDVYVEKYSNPIKHMDLPKELKDQFNKILKVLNSSFKGSGSFTSDGSFIKRSDATKKDVQEVILDMADKIKENIPRMQSILIPKKKGRM